MTDTTTAFQLEEVSKTLEAALQDDNHEFWGKFGKAFEGHESVDDLRNEIQADDDRKRKESGPEPRPWPEIEKQMEEESARTLENFDEDLVKWDTEQRKSQGLEPRSKEEIEEEVMPKLSGLMEEFVYKYDTKKRKELGLPPRPRQEFEAVLKEEAEALGYQ
ncbi:MAG: hypothetical protein Q9219_000637 [cf. Caloplaca sp. 3 TL-2023]